MGTTAEKGQRVLQSIAEVQEGINNLGGSLTDQTPFKNFRAELDNIYNNLPKTNYAEGSNITLSNTLKGKLDFEDDIVGYGQTSQKTYEGYNLIDIKSGSVISPISGVTCIRDGDMLTINGSRDDGSVTAAKIIVDTLSLFKPLESGKTYKLTLNEYSGSYTGKIGLSLQGGSPLTQKDFIETNTNVNPYSASKTLSFSGDISVIKVVINGAFTANNFKCKIMLQETTAEYPYEPYVGGIASPNPSYPQEVKVVRGKNLLDKSIIKEDYIVNSEGLPQ